MQRLTEDPVKHLWWRCCDKIGYGFCRLNCIKLIKLDEWHLITNLISITLDKKLSFPLRMDIFCKCEQIQINICIHNFHLPGFQIYFVLIAPGSNFNLKPISRSIKFKESWKPIIEESHLNKRPALLLCFNFSRKMPQSGKLKAKLEGSLELAELICLDWYL